MASRTQTQLNSDADTYLADNSSRDISAEDVRQRVKDIADSCWNRNAYGPTIVTESGATTIFTPASDSNAARGTALEAAFSAMAAGDLLSVPPGVYTLSTDWTPPASCTIVGAGAGATTIDAAGNAVTLDDSLEFRDLKFLATNFTGDAIQQLRFSGVEFDGTGMAATTDIVYLSGINSFSIRFLDCRFSNATRDNVRIVDACAVTFIGCQFRDATRHGASFDGTGQHGSTSDYSNSTCLMGCIFAGNGGDGVNSKGDHDIRITGCASEYNTGSGFYLEEPIQPSIVGNLAEYNGTTSYTNANIVLDLGNFSGYGVTESTVVISGNNLSNNGSTVHNIKIIGTHNSKYNLLIGHNNFLDLSTTEFSSSVNCSEWQANYGLVYNGNFHSGIAGATGDTGLALLPSTGTVTSRGVNISGNHFLDLDTYALRIQGITDVSIVGNTFDGNANALYSADGSGTYHLVGNTFLNSSGDVINLTGGSETYTAQANIGLSDTIKTGRTSAASDPTTTEYPTSGDWGIHKNTSSGNVYIAANDGGSIVKAQLS